MSDQATIIFPGANEPHVVGNAACNAGWCRGLPERCVCGGLIHYDFHLRPERCDRCLSDDPVPAMRCAE